MQTFQRKQSGEGEATADATGGLATIAALAQMRVLGAIWVGVGATAELGTASLTYHGATDSQPMSTRELGVVLRDPRRVGLAGRSPVGEPRHLV